MLYIGWPILNFGILCLFLFYCLVAGKVIRQTIALGPLLLILFGLIALGSGPAAPAIIEKEPPVVLTGPAERLFVPVADFYIASIRLLTTYQHERICHNDMLPDGFWLSLAEYLRAHQAGWPAPAVRHHGRNGMKSTGPKSIPEA